MRKQKCCLALILIAIIIMTCMGCKKDQEQENKYFPEGLDEIGCASMFDADLEHKVVDKDLIDEFTNMLNKCEFRETSSERTYDPEEARAKMGIVIIKMGDLVFYLERDGRFKNLNEDKYYYLENFDSDLFERFWRTRFDYKINNSSNETK